MGKNKIGAYITLDGEKEFRTAVTSCNKSISTMKSEMKLVDAQTAGNANSIEALRKKHDVLSKTLDEQINKEKAIKAGLEHAEKEYMRVGKELEDYKGKLEAARNELEDMKESSDTTEEALNKQRDTVTELTQIVGKGEETYRKAGDKVQDWKKQLNNAEAQTIRATRAVNENAAYMKEAEKATDGCAKSIDEFGNKTKNLADEIVTTGNIIKANLINTVADAGKDLAKGIFDDAIKGTLDLQDAQNQLRASTGATAKETKEYSAQMKELYSEGYADDINAAAEAMSLVKQYTNETDATKIQELAEGGIALEDTFNIGLSESIRGVDALMKNMNLTATEAFDLMAKGAQNGLNKSGELGDNLAEYTQLWEQAGFSAQEMFAIMDNGLNSGAYNLDKVNDFVKEFGISLSDGRIKENLGAFSEDTQKLFAEWQNGETSTKEVFSSVISDLSNMTNQQQALTIASNTWSSLGEDNAMKIITSLNQTNDKYKDVKGTMEEIKKIKYDSVSNQWKILGRTLQTDVIQPVLVKFLPGAQKGIRVLTDHIDTIAPVAATAGAAIGTIYTVNKARKFIGEVKETGKSIVELTAKVFGHTAAKTADTAVEAAATAARGADTAATVAQTTATAAQTVATTEATVAQTGLNAAMSANPVALVVVGITALVGVTAVLASNVEVAKDKTDELSEEADKLSDKVRKSKEDLEESTKDMSNSLEEVGASGTLANNLAVELEKLSGQSKRTAEEQGRMRTIVAELNQMFPDMSLSVDEVTGKLSMSSSEMKNYINQAIQMQKVQAAQEAMKKSVEKLVEAEINQTEVAGKLNEVNSELENIEKKRAEANAAVAKKSEAAQEAQEAYNEALKNGSENAEELYLKTQEQSEATIEYNGKVMAVSEALQQMAEDEMTLQNTKEGLKETQEEANAAIEEANEKMAPYTDYLNGMADAEERSTEATRNSTDAKKEAVEQAEASIEISGQELEAYSSLSTAQQDMATNVTNAVLTMQENVQGALQSQMDMFEKFDGGVQISTEQLLTNMQSQVDGVSAWEQNLSELADRGINQGILQKLAEMGPQGSGYVAAFNSMTDEELAKANELWSQSLDIQGMTNEWGQQLLESGAANVAGGMQNLTPIMQESGANTVLGLVRGMQEAQATATTAGRDLGVKTIEAVDIGLGCHSPSTKTQKSGENVNQGLANGMKKTSAVSNAAKETANAAINPIKTMLREEQFIEYGYNVSLGLAKGILKGDALVINASTKVAGDAITAAKEKLEINSPSHAFERIGEGSMEGYVVGVDKNAKMARDAVATAVDFSGMDARIDATTPAFKEGYVVQKMIVDAIKNINLVAYLNDRQLTRALSELGVVFNGA